MILFHYISLANPKSSVFRHNDFTHSKTRWYNNIVTNHFTNVTRSKTRIICHKSLYHKAFYFQHRNVNEYKSETVSETSPNSKSS